MSAPSAVPFSLNPKQSKQEEFTELAGDKQKYCWGAITALIALLTIAYLDSFERISYAWNTPQYSHGYLIPLFAIALLAMRKRPFVEVPDWHRWVGCGIVAFGIAMRVFGGWTVTFFLDNLSFIPLRVWNLCDGRRSSIAQMGGTGNRIPVVHVSISS